MSSEPDGLPVSPSWHGSLLELIRILTGVVLTGDGAYLAHAAHHNEQEEAGETEQELLWVAREWDRLRGCLQGLTRELEAARESTAATRAAS